jgi:hypothetical protein
MGGPSASSVTSWLPARPTALAAAPTKIERQEQGAGLAAARGRAGGGDGLKHEHLHRARIVGPCVGVSLSATGVKGRAPRGAQS